tara:strand:+ start:7 stop:3159 length:3153 start_codon:yes stop_codon:yes gene_type:complete
MTKVAPIATMAGFSIEETTAIMAKLSDTGIEASIAGTSLRNIFLKMQDPTSDLTRRVGHTISSLDRMLEVFKEMQDEGTDLGEVLTFMDDRQIAAFGTMLHGADDMKALVEELKNADGAGQRMADTVGDTLQGSIFKVKSAFQGLSIALVKNFGKSLQKVLESFAKWLNEIVESDSKIRKLWLQIKTATRFIAALVIGLKPAKIALAAMGTTATGAAGGMSAAAGATAVLSAALKTLRLAIVSTGIGLLVIALGEWVASMMGINEETYKFVSLQDQVNEAMVDASVEIEMVNQSLLNLIDAKTTLNRLTDSEGRLIDKSSVSTLEYNNAKAKEKRALKDINKIRKQYGLTLITEKDLIGDIKKETEELMKVMQDKAMADIYMELEREAVREIVTAKTIRKELQPFLDEMDEWEKDSDLGYTFRENERYLWKKVIAKYIRTAKSNNQDLRMPTYIHEQSNWLAGIFGYGNADEMIAKQKASLEKDTNVAAIGLSRLLEKYEMTMATFLEILDPGQVASIDYMDYLEEYEASPGMHWYDEFSSGLPIGSTAASDEYLKRQREALKEIMESTSQTSLEELLGTDYPDGDGPDDDGPDEEDALWSLQDFMNKARDIVNTAMLDPEISQTLFGKIIGEEDYNLTMLEGQLEAVKQFIAQYDETEHEHNQDIIAAKQKRNDILLKIDKEAFKKSEEEIDKNYDVEKALLEQQRNQGLIDEWTYQAQLHGITGEWLRKKIELYDNANKDISALENQQIINTSEAYRMLIDERDAAISSFAEMGGLIEEMAGDEERLQGLRKVGIAITKAAAVAESIFTLQKEISALADKKKAMYALQAQIQEAGGISTTLAAGFANLFKAGTNAAEGVTKQSGLVFPYNLIAMAGTVLAIISTIASIKSLFGGDYGASAAGAPAPSEGGVSTSGAHGGSKTESMTYYTFGGQHSTFADGGMVYGNSHSQGGEMFALGGRVVELEGGEAVINKRSTSMFRSQLSAMNSAGGGVRFADGGVTNNPSFAQTEFDVMNQGANKESSKVVVVEADITSTQNTVKTIEAEATF